jgi:hypothetical protein
MPHGPHVVVIAAGDDIKGVGFRIRIGAIHNNPDRRTARRGRSRGSGTWCWRRRRSCLHFKRPHVDAPVTHTPKIGATLIVERRGSELRIACVNGWTPWQQRMGRCRATIVLKWPKQRIGIDLIARTCQKATAIVAAHVISVRCDRSRLSDVKVNTRCSSSQDRIPDV